MKTLDTLIDHFWDGFRCMSLSRPRRLEVICYGAWKRAVALQYRLQNGGAA
jgi:hypothetical protein